MSRMFHLRPSTEIHLFPSKGLIDVLFEGALEGREHHRLGGHDVLIQQNHRLQRKTCRVSRQSVDLSITLQNIRSSLPAQD